jgi:RNA polymerase sigma-70 factor, ECF subfamily
VRPNVPSPSRESAIRAACQRGDVRAAATLAIESYGPEILGYLRAIVADEGAAGDVFSVFCEDVWRGLDGFAWRCSARGWCYTLAHHAAMRHLRSPREQPALHVPLSQVSDVGRLAEEVRSSTARAPTSERKSRLRRLREQLPVEEQALLVLRIDKQLPWSEVALVLFGEGGEPARKSAAARQRFQALKDKLRRLAAEEGLL